MTHPSQRQRITRVPPGSPAPRRTTGSCPVTQQVQVTDAVGAGERPAHHTGRLHRRARRRDTPLLLQQVVPAGRLGQQQLRHQACIRHQVRVIKDRTHPVRSFHLRGDPSVRQTATSAIPSSLPSRVTSTHATPTPPATPVDQGRPADSKTINWSHERLWGRD